MFAVVINPISGKGKGSVLGAEVAGYLRTRNIDYTLVASASAALLSQNLETLIETTDVDGIIAVGGDGLLHLVLQIAAKASLPFAVVPAGTGNDFARALGIHERSVSEILDHVLSTNPSAVDLGLVDSEYFGAILSSGFDSVVNERANKLSWPKGPSRYNAAMILELPKFSPISYQIQTENRSFDVEAMLIAIGNGISYGGGMKVCPDADIHDGLFDVMILHPVSKVEFLRIFPSVYTGRHIHHPQVETFRARSISLHSKAVAYADGERIGQLPVKAECIQGAALAWSL
jgi:diacylglycerol kinase (ATP)